MWHSYGVIYAFIIIIFNLSFVTPSSTDRAAPSLLKMVNESLCEVRDEKTFVTNMGVM